MEPLVIKTDYKKSIQDLAFKAIRRGLTFTAISLSSSPSLSNFNKSVNPSKKDSIQLQLLNPQDDKEFEKSIEWYKHYVNVCGLREMLEGFHFFIDKTIFFIKSKELTNKTVSVKDYQAFCRSHKSFEKSKGYIEKLNHLNNCFETKMDKNMLNCLSSLNIIRNCLAHNMGIVSDVFPASRRKGYAKIEWMSLKLYTIGCDTGQKRKLKFGSAAPESVNVVAKNMPHTKELPYGSYLFFEYQEIHEIAFSLYSAIGFIGENVKKFYEKEGDK